ncbi:twin-arginine translocase TatA/TatE family subunit [Corynebacterium poyangense]|uniref:Sec-independent protein translocase protein TatA n=1 Tax=Corynebacterium poyangense TaxID=2684405 RepID=A0A7H0SNU2_9CORY|nr:Sec-independent protein translocase subunit TatA [Corynebacterium poyangense]MBZ8177771.1 twin-arginine translocase TatA/TatE family subunit [Corynebacterium poyangense]QNQ90217.1 twin-arginine translocase TatA/TatE family subunit [Corynebacterium poyangense]
MTLGAPELLVIFLLIILLFGAKRLPDAARSMGRSLRIFKSEVKEMSKDDERDNQAQIAASQPPVQQPIHQPQPQVNYQPQQYPQDPQQPRS